MSLTGINSLAGSAGAGAPVSALLEVADIAARDAIAALDRFQGMRVLVIDASADVNVGSGRAFYQLGAGLTNLDWLRISEEEAMDLDDTDGLPQGATNLYNQTHTGDVTGSILLTIAADAVDNTKLANMPTLTIKGNNTGGAADPIDLTVSDVNALLGTAPALLTTKGDLLVHNVTTEARFPVGTNGQVIVADSTQPDGMKWESAIPNPVIQVIGIGMDGDTSFFISSQPTSPAAFDVYLNGQLRLRGLDYTQIASVFTWLDPGGVILKTTDTLVLRWTDNALIASSVTKEIFISGTDYSDNNGDYRVISLSQNGSQRFTFHIPNDFASLTSIKLIGIPSAGAAGAAKDIDLSSEYGAIGEASNNFTESDIATTYDLTGTSGEITEVLDLNVVLSSLAAGQFIGVFVDHNGIGGAIDYLGVKLIYKT